MTPPLRHLHLQPAININQRTMSAADQTDDFGTQVDRDQQRDHHDESCPFRRLRQEDRHRSEEKADRVDHQHRRAMGETHVQQAVMKMAFVRARDRFFVDDSPYNSEKGIPERYTQHHDRNDERNEKCFLKAHDR